MKLFGIKLWSRAQRQTYRELSRMTDFELKDIGLTRGDIYNLVEGME